MRTHPREKSEQSFNPKKKCQLRQQTQNLGKCPQFFCENVYDRQQTLRRLHLCPKCFCEHLKGQCNSKYRCQKDNCNGFHHSTKHSNNFQATQSNNQGLSQSIFGYRHNGDSLNRNQFNFRNINSSGNKNSSSNNPNYNHHTRQDGNSNYNRQRSGRRNHNNYNNNNNINTNFNNNNSNSFNSHNRTLHSRQSYQLPNTFNVQQQQPTF